MTDEAERAWRRYANERGWQHDEDERRLIFLAGFEVGAEHLAGLHALEMDQLVRSNIEAMRDVYEQGLRRVATELQQISDEKCAALVVDAVLTIDAALSFHPMHFESWPGWPGKQEGKTEKECKEL